MDRRVLLGECKWRNDADASEVAKKIFSKEYLLGEYKERHYCLFVKKRAKNMGAGSYLMLDGKKLDVISTDMLFEL